MPDWWRDAPLITALVLLFEAATGRIGAAVRWVLEWRNSRRLERREEEAARKSVRALEETISLKDQELQMQDRIIARLTKENDRLNGQRNGGTP